MCDSINQMGGGDVKRKKFIMYGLQMTLSGKSSFFFGGDQLEWVRENFVCRGAILAFWFYVMGRVGSK